MAHDVFISYSRKDREFAIRLQKALANYAPPRDLSLPRRRLDVFRDEEDFTGAEYYQSLDRHLNNSGKLIVLCSPAARGSQFVNDEIRRFAGKKGAENIIALLVAGLPNNEATPEQQAQMAFPDALCEAMKMPLAADYRGFDAKRSKVDRGAFEASWYTTLANIYDVSRAQIEQREKKRRARRRQITVAVTAASIIVLAGLSFIAWNQRQDAIRQQSMVEAGSLTRLAVANESTRLSQGLRLRALIAAESLRTAWTPEGYNAWRLATLKMPPILGRINTDAGLISMAFTADGKQLFALCGKRHVHVFSVPELRELKKLDAYESAAELTIDRQGERVLAYHLGEEFIQALDLRTESTKGISLRAGVTSANFGRGGEAVVTSLTNLWVVDATSDEVRSRVTFPKETSTVTLGPDGATVLALTDKTLTAYDTADGKVRWELPLSGEAAGREAVFRGDGLSVMVRGSSGLSIVNAATGEMQRTLPGKPISRGRTTLFNDDAYAIGNMVYGMSGDIHFELPFLEEPAPFSTLPAVSASGRHIAGTLQDDMQNFAVIDLSIRGRSVAEDIASLYLTLPEGYQGKVAAFTADGYLLALSSGAVGYGQQPPAELQLVSLKPDRWRSMFPSRSRTGDLNVLPPDSRVVAKHRSSPAARSFDADGTPVADDGNGTFVSPSGRFAARLERGKGWIVTDTTDKRSVTIPENGSPIEYSPDERRVLVFPKIYALDNPTAPETVADAKPFYHTWSFPGSNLVIGVDADSMSMSDTRKSVLFDWESGKVSDGPASVNSIYAIRSDGRRFVTYDHDVILLWKTGATEPDVRSGRASVTHDTPVYFSPDGKLLAVARCGGVPLYDVDTLERRFEVPIGNSCFAGLSLDGKYLVSRTWHSDAPEPTLHPITLEGVLEETCSKVRDNLTERERRRLGVAFTNTCPDRSATPGGSAPSAAN
jgi:outer membrane protein assembly factor BamB